MSTRFYAIEDLTKLTGIADLSHHIEAGKSGAVVYCKDIFEMDERDIDSDPYITHVPGPWQIYLSFAESIANKFSLSFMRFGNGKEITFEKTSSGDFVPVAYAHIIEDGCAQKWGVAKYDFRTGEKCFYSEEALHPLTTAFDKVGRSFDGLNSLFKLQSDVPVPSVSEPLSADLQFLMDYELDEAMKMPEKSIETALKQIALVKERFDLEMEMIPAALREATEEQSVAATLFVVTRYAELGNLLQAPKVLEIA